MTRSLAQAVSDYDVADPFATCQTVGSLPPCVNLTLYAGDDFYLDLTVKNPDGTPADLSGATATAQIKAKTGDTTALADFTATIAGNVITLHLPADESAGLPPTAVWDCQIATPDITTLAAGVVTTAQQVTTP